MKTTIIEVAIKFTETLLGSSPGNPNLHAEFVASKAPTVTTGKDETKAIENQLTETERQQLIAEETVKAMTVFPSDEMGLFVYDYQIRGFFKESVAALIHLGEIKGLSLWAHKKAVDNFLFVRPRRCYLFDHTGTIIKQAAGRLERPLRAETMQGERVALANSETLPPGTILGFKIELLEATGGKSKVAVITPENLKTCLEYGSMKGFGQWRSGGFGRFDITAFNILTAAPEK